MTTAAIPTTKIHGAAVGDEDLRKWLQDFIAEHPHLNTAVLSRSDHIGFSKSALDPYIEGKYFLPKKSGGMGVDPSRSGLEQKIRAYRDKVEGIVRNGYKRSFIETRNWHQFQHAAKTAITERVIVVIYGEPGVGKSRCKLEFSKSNLSTRPIEILCSANITTRYFVQKIARELGLPETYATAKLEDLIAEKLKKNPRPIIVDQGNYLHEKALGTCCYLWDVAEIPIMLIGTKVLFDLSNTSTLTEDVRRQLSSRIAMNYQLMGLSIEEVKSIAVRVLGERATTPVVQRIMKATRGNHRHLDMMMPRLSQSIDANADLIETGDVTVEDLVDKASSRLMLN